MNNENYEPRSISLSGCKEIGRGQCATVMQIAEDRVVKMYFESVPKEEILKEYDQTCEAYRLGINSEQCFGMVTGDNRLGIELEFIKGESLQDAILKNPKNVSEYGKLMAEELELINSKSPNPKLFPPISEFYLDCTKKCCQDGWLTSEEAQKIEKFIQAVPECNTMVHGDYHILNLMYLNNQIRLIDMADCTTGNPIYDLMITNLYMHYAASEHPEDFGMLFKISPEQGLSVWDAFVRCYFNTEDEARISKINDILNVYSMLKHILAPYSYDNMDKSMFKRFVEMGRAGLMPKIEEYTGVIPAKITELGKGL
ncbi:MAG: phosphotransferase [Lachnospiraceae bacterium]|nr:phosphotransferase [Lachnospiraceae bacterium]